MMTNSIGAITKLMVGLRCQSPHRLPGLCADIATTPNTAAIVMCALAGLATRDLRDLAAAAPGPAIATFATLGPDGQPVDVDSAPADVVACGRILTAMVTVDTATAYALATAAVQQLPDRVPYMLANLTDYAHQAVHQ